MTLGQGQLDLPELETIAELLMGAAYADGTLDGSEMKEVVKVLAELLETDPESLPESVLTKLSVFEAEEFDIESACNGLTMAESQDRRGLLALLSKICDADDVHDLEEAHYIRRVADLIGASDEECKGLAMEVVQVREVNEPPPTPTDA
ncbi:MAG: TerB family tellurite resistance protein [Myxococcales bacterium]|nr:TerB family tellurite resistance protein [Myxococcales bacterium]